jgi:chromosomal replication initiation ATPase DnaA
MIDGAHSRAAARVAVEEVTWVSLKEMHTKSRHHEIAEARAILAWLLHGRCRMSWPEIAAFMSRTGHSTFIEAARRAPTMPKFQATVKRFDELTGVGK